MKLRHFFEVNYPEVVLVPKHTAIADVATASELLICLRDEPEETRTRFFYWVFQKLREKYQGAWDAVWEDFLKSPLVEALVSKFEEDGRADIMSQAEDILRESGFEEE